MKTLTFIFFSFIVVLNAHAWGPTGHRVVGEVAYKYLDRSTLIKVKKILNHQNLARVSNWADEIRSDPTKYSYTFTWHFMDWADEATTFDENASVGTLMKALNEQLKILGHSQSSNDQKSFALKFVIHLVGDLHMPLHVGNGLDHGANDCKITFHGKAMSLHQLWDEALIDFTNLSFTELASFVAQGVSASTMASWKEGAPMDWARESKEMRRDIYPESTSGRPYCRPGSTGNEPDLPKLGYEYSYKFVPVIEKRLFQAGIRLGVLLNKTLK